MASTLCLLNEIEADFTTGATRAGEREVDGSKGGERGWGEREGGRVRDLFSKAEADFTTKSSWPSASIFRSATSCVCKEQAGSKSGALRNADDEVCACVDDLDSDDA